MPEILLRSKIGIPPLRKPAVARTHLLESSNSGLIEEDHFLRKLTLISAPAGYGKTTLAAEWLNSLGHPVAWLSVDETDNDPTRFLSYLISAIQSILPEIGDTALAMVQSPQRPPGEILLARLINDLGAQRSLIFLVLDDYHFINNLAIHQQLSFLLEHLPVNVHLVLLTREDPLIPIGRLRARNQVLEIRQKSLRFNVEETQNFMSEVMKLKLAREDILALERRTEGWPAGLQLVGITMKEMADQRSFIREFTGNTRFILDYLMEEVVNRQPEHVRDFLLGTSILERLCGPLCEAVTGQQGGSELLGTLEQNNMFIVSLDGTGSWYRYHNLFSELLRHQQQISGRPVEASLLHQRACKWLSEAGYTAEAIQHALAARDWENAAQLITQADESMLMHGEAMTLAGWLDKLPEEVIFAQPDLCLTHAWALLLIQKYERAARLLNQAEQLAPAGSMLLGQVATAQAYLARATNDNKGVIQASRLALTLLPEDDLVSRSNLFMNLGLVYWHDGQLNEAEPALVEALDKSQKSGNLNAQVTAEIFLARTLASRGELHAAESKSLAIIRRQAVLPVIALAYFDLSALYYEWNQLDKAELYLQSGLDICKRTGDIEFLTAGEMMQACLAVARRDWGLASQTANTAWGRTNGLSVSLQRRCAATQASVALAIGDLKTAEEWLERAGGVDAHPFYRFLELNRPRWLIAQGKLEEARECLQEAHALASMKGWGYGLVVTRILQSLTASTMQDAEALMDEALESAEPEGYIRSFIDAGMGVLPLLRSAVRRGANPGYAERILKVMGVKRAPGQAKKAALAEPLSEREIEVLRLVVAGLSNREIASKLFISTGTAKTHVHHLFGKLGVTSRIQAVRRAKELDLE